jgi:hypothetical protein
VNVSTHARRQALIITRTGYVAGQVFMLDEEKKAMEELLDSRPGSSPGRW